MNLYVYIIKRKTTDDFQSTIKNLIFLFFLKIIYDYKNILFVY